ncbi:hypothetical protein A2U01_0054426, partial [Trifolium medium]|nr:hypothetical protein [Trifolium medium]
MARTKNTGRRTVSASPSPTPPVHPPVPPPPPIISNSETFETATNSELENPSPENQQTSEIPTQTAEIGTPEKVLAETILKMSQSNPLVETTRPTPHLSDPTLKPPVNYVYTKSKSKSTNTPH